MTAAGPAVPPVLPEGDIRRILILRTAQIPELQWARAELARRYPEATIGVLGTRLAALGAFDDCERFEVEEGWLTPETIAPLRPALSAFAPDLVVLCLNNDWRVGYERASRVVRAIKARHNVVAGYNRRWHPWRHADFVDGHPVRIWLAEWLGMAVLTPLVAGYLLARPAGPVYQATPRRRPAGEARA